MGNPLAEPLDWNTRVNPPPQSYRKEQIEGVRSPWRRNPLPIHFSGVAMECQGPPLSRLWMQAREGFFAGS
jgi:hypothetical protein